MTFYHTSKPSGAEVLTTFGTFWCDIEPMSGKEMSSLGGVTAQGTTKITMRFVRNFTAALVGICNGQRYNITYVDNVKKANKELQLLATEV
jgi:SPP1 family predicted phage head-tail adaptor